MTEQLTKAIQKHTITEGRLTFDIPHFATSLLQSYLSKAKETDQSTPVLKWYYTLPQKEQMLVSVARV